MLQRKLFVSYTLIACLVVAAGCTDSADQASSSSEITEVTTLSAVIADHVRDTDFIAIARALNPIVNTGSGCNRTLASVDTVEHGAVDVQIVPTAAGSATRIIVVAPVVRGHVQYRLACLTFTAAFTLRADAYAVDGVVVPRVESGALAVTFDGATGAFDNLRVEVAGVPSAIVNALVTAAGPLLTSALSQAVAAKIPLVVDPFLAGPALAELGGAIGDALTAADLGAVLQSMNPVVDTGGDGCAGAQAFVSSATHGPGEVVLGQTPEGIDTAVSVPSLVVTGWIDFRIVCITGRANFTITANAYRATGVTALTVDGATVAAGFQTTDSTLDHFQIDVSSVPSPIVELVVPLLLDQLTAVADDQVAQVLPSHVGRFFNEFLSH